MSESDIHADEAEDIWSPDGDLPDPETDDAPEADAVEQRQEVVGHEPGEQPNVAYDVDPADAAEQRRVVDYDEDDYR